MTQRCSFCNSYEEIVYTDYAPPRKDSWALYIYICWKCAILFNLGFEEVKEKISKLFPKMLLCSKCHDKFIPSKPSHNICRACYLKSKQQEQQVEVWRFA